MEQVVHRSGPLKQKNKSHSGGKHRTKGRIRKESHGQVNVITISKRQKKAAGKSERRFHANQQRQKKRELVLEQKRSLGGAGSPPLLTAVVSLSPDLDASQFVKTLTENELVTGSSTNDMGVMHFSLPRFRKRLELVTPDPYDMFSVLDALKVSDSVLFLLSPDERGLDESASQLLTGLLAQGLPSVFLGLTGLRNLPPKKQNDVRKQMQKSIEKWFRDEKLHVLDSDSDMQVLLRLLSDHKPRRSHWRENRPYLLAESVDMSVSSENPAVGTLAVSGYIRGQTLSVNKLVHLPGWGDFQMSQIAAPNDPYPLQDGKQQRKTMDTDDSPGEVKVLDKATPSLQESLQAEVIPDPMEGEQTWPTEEELREADNQIKELKRVPRGTSAYQASWIVQDSGSEAGDSEDDEMQEEMDGAAAAEDKSDSEESADDGDDAQEYETISMTEGGDARYDAAMDLTEEASSLARIKEAREHTMFPDEVDTPKEVPARTRFQRYRGLKSFRTSPWDPKENLPLDYARIYQFQNFKQTKKRAIQDAQETEGAMPGWYVTIHILNVPVAYLEHYKPGRPLVVFGLLSHEHKISMCHYVLRRHVEAECQLPVKSKDPVIFHVGYRRFEACPIYSQHTAGTRHKFERFLPDEGVCVGSAYAPIMYPPAPVLMFQAGNQGNPMLLASGSLLSINPDRIVAKRIILSGHPFKINKQAAVVRYMFFARDDIVWFKKVELRTKWGRRGHIKEPLGTHGHMKCVFDGQLKSQDTVLMNLYKRIYPKWTYNPRIMM